MFMFLIKKAFFDMWDHFLGVAMLNLGFIALLTIPILVPPAVVETSVALAFFSQAVGILLVVVYAGAVSLATRDMVNYQRPEFRKLIEYLKESWKSSLVFGAILIGIVIVLWFGVPVYAGMGNLLGLAAIVFLLWALIIWGISSQYYFPIRGQLDTKIPKIIRKCFVLFFDNTFFSILLAIGTIVIAVGSVFTALLIPGITGLLIWHHAGLKLRLLKYDYLEENPSANRRRIPWDALLVDEEERVGKRTLRGMIFPWKE